MNNFQGQFDFGSGAQQRRDFMLKKVIANTPPGWSRRYYEKALEQPRIKEPFSGEDFRLFIQPVIGNPHHHNAWGAHWNQLVQLGWVVPAGLWKHMEGPKSNARLTFTYFWYKNGHRPQ
jgi:hypothetical protein